MFCLINLQSHLWRPLSMALGLLKSFPRLEIWNKWDYFCRCLKFISEIKPLPLQEDFNPLFPLSFFLSRFALENNFWKWISPLALRDYCIAMNCSRSSDLQDVWRVRRVVVFDWYPAILPIFQSHLEPEIDDFGDDSKERLSSLVNEGFIIVRRWK